MKACPTTATWTEPDGIVVIDYNWCIGCRYCMAACPYGARHFNWTEPGIPTDELNPNTNYLGNLPREHGVVEKAPFVSIDVDGIGALVEMGVKKGRSTTPNLKIGICGEHGGDPASIRFCHEVGLDYVSCSPFRVPIARLAAAQAQLDKPIGD